jgi:LysM repeat protein
VTARRRALRWAAALAVIAATARGTYAQDSNRPVPYRVKQGDTFELIAAEFYGDRTKAVFLLEENKLTHARPLRPGERLRIPISRDVTTAPGDSFESLAMTYLGSARRASFLADFNGMSQDSLPAGSSITIPFTIVHTAQSTESLSDIAKAYFGDGKNAEMLRRYNFLEKSAIDKGEQLIVPVYHVRLSAAKQPALDAESKARREHRREATTRAARALPAARQAWRAGDYTGVKAALTPLEADLDYLDADEAASVGVLLGAAHIAFDNPELAMVCFKRVLDRQGQYTLRRYDYAPKVLAVWQKAGGPIE